jgi:hypothetical protein
LKGTGVEGVHPDVLVPTGTGPDLSFKGIGMEGVHPDVLVPTVTGPETVDPDVLKADSGVDNGISGFCALRRALNCFCRSLPMVPFGKEGLRALSVTSFRNLR